jgi:GDP-4-dehydro-6-deoxy-D-mannose reductase
VGTLRDQEGPRKQRPREARRFALATGDKSFLPCDTTRMTARGGRALVTGATGFTGRVLCRLLAEEGLKVFAAGRRSPAVGTFVPLAWPTSQKKLAGIVSRVRPDYLFHLAGVAHGLPPRSFYEINAAYAAALLDELRRAGRPCRALLVGTSAEYGQIASGDLPIREDCPPRPYGHYGISKLAQTQLGLAFHSPGLSVVVARPFNLIGPGMPSFLSVQSFVDQLVEMRGKKADKVLRVGNLQPSRDYLHVGAAAEAYLRLIRADEAQGRVVNVCSGTPTPMRDVVDALLRVAGQDIRIEVDPGRVKPIDVPVHYGDNRLLRELTGLAPALDLRAALEEAFRHSVRSRSHDHR